jgi:D-alanine--poly(phosphoribitol) ligase subunit 1
MLDDPIAPFLGHALSGPRQPAVDGAADRATYADLDAMARRFAQVFRRPGGATVMIALPPGAAAYAAMLGTLLAGGTYVPVNTATPRAKIDVLIDQVRPDLIVAARDLSAGLAVGGAGLVDPADLAAVVPMAGAGTRHERAYVIMTSGSTGVPKGVVIPTTALAHYLGWVRQSGLIRAADRVSQFANISFDVSVLEIYGALNAGAVLVPPADDYDRLFPADFARRARLSVWVSVPSAIELAMTGRQMTAEMIGSVRQFIFCGEPLRPAHLKAIFDACPQTAVLNAYGPTETTVTMTALPLQASDYAAACDGTVAIGEPIAGIDILLLGGPHPDEGEIVITGPQLALGYHGDTARTARSFRPVELNGAMVRGYFSGDWGERKQGRLFCRGRIDSQMKVRGYRVEAGEIGARLAECGWPITCVLLHDAVLTAVIETQEPAAMDASAIREQLRVKLDSYAVPEQIVAMPRIPRTINGKLDERGVRAWLDAQAAPGARAGQA